MAVTEKRRSDRIFIPVPIYLAGKQRSGITFEENTYTGMVCRHGGSVIFQHDLSLRQLVYVKNLYNGHEGKFRVVEEVRSAFAGQREWGLEAVTLNNEFWGIRFPLRPNWTHPKLLLKCLVCTNRQLMRVSSPDYGFLLECGQIPSYCSTCDETTQWEPSWEGFPPQNTQRSLEAAARTEGRKYRRLKLTMLLQLRNRNNGVQTVQTVDVSRSGLRFTSRRTYEVGGRVYVTLPFGDWEEPIETRARTVRAQPGRTQHLYGLRYE